MSEALGLVTIGEKGGEVFLGASLQDLGSVGPRDAEPDRQRGRAPGRRRRGAGRGDPRSQLEHGRGDRRGPARAGDALRRGARRGAVHGAGGDAGGAHAGAPRRAAALHHDAIPTRGRTASRSDARSMRRSRRRPRRRWSVALIALVLSTTGLADAARHAVVSAIDGHPDQHQAPRRRHAAARQEQEIPRLGDPHGEEREQGGRQDRDAAGRHLPAGDRSTSARWCLETSPYPLTNADVGKNNYIFASQDVRGRRRLAADCRAAARRRRPRQARVHDPRLAADRHGRPGPDPRA